MRGSPIGRRCGSGACSSCSLSPRSGPRPRQAEHEQRHGERREARVVEDEPERSGDEPDAEDHDIRTPELEKRGDKRRPAENAAHEKMDRGKSRRAGQALLAGLASKAYRRVLNDAVAEIE